MKINSFNLKEGEVINGKYEVLELLGKGSEGEVYLVKELTSDIPRTAKIFYPGKNKRNAISKKHAKKLHKLKHCSMIIHYHTQEVWYYEGIPVTIIISEYVEGELLSDFVKRQPGKRLHPYVALHLLHSMAKGLEEIHHVSEYHGDLHTENFIVQRFGLQFEIKLLDFHDRGSAKRDNIKDDVIDLVNIFYEILGGKKHYSKLPKPIKDICCGLKKTLILKKFNTAGKLKKYIEHIEW